MIDSLLDGLLLTISKYQVSCLLFNSPTTRQLLVFWSFSCDVNYTASQVIGFHFSWKLRAPDHAAIQLTAANNLFMSTLLLSGLCTPEPHLSAPCGTGIDPINVLPQVGYIHLFMSTADKLYNHQRHHSIFPEAKPPMPK